VLRRIARLADGWMPNFEPDEFGQSVVERLRGYAREAGRDPTSIGIEATVNVLGRDPEQWVEEALAWQRLGATHLSANTLREVWSKERLTWSKAEGAPLGPDEHIEALRRYREVVAAALPSS
jgi:alkanesulfonate monooxygenase SsuD/methylene tetrahydromethanopterin reductase-like flavin-dependent oxidoreductase (luciferase family)